MQKNSNNETWSQKNRTASEAIVGGQTFMWMDESKVTDFNRLGYGVLEYILSPNNLNAAYLQVMRNKGAGCVDKMEVESLKDYLVRNKSER
jgi:RNA-directed DNA polymerase